MLKLLKRLLLRITGRNRPLMVQRDPRRRFTVRYRYRLHPPRRFWILLLLLVPMSMPAAPTPSFDAVLRSFSTVYEGLGEERAGNIEKAARALNGTVIPPGEVFSFNETLGRRTIDTGYSPAPTFIYGELEETPGGGVCQVSSTLYNAGILSGLSVVERHRHSQPVSYLPPGRDATVSYGALDLKLKNPHDMPVKLVAEARDGRLSFRFLAPRPLPVRYEIRSTRKLEDAPETGANPAVEVVTERIEKRDGKVVRVETLSRDRFPATVGKDKR